MHLSYIEASGATHVFNINKYVCLLFSKNEMMKSPVWSPNPRENESPWNKTIWGGLWIQYSNIKHNAMLYFYIDPCILEEMYSSVALMLESQVNSNPVL